MARSSSTTNPVGKPAGKAVPKGTARSRQTPRRARAGNGPLLTLVVIFIMAVAMTALPLAILLLVGTLPTWVAGFVDRHRRYYLARTVGAINLAGVMPGVLRMWEQGITFSNLQMVIGSPYSWLVMYGAAAFGWLLYFCVPPVVGMIVEVRIEDTKRRLEARAKALIEEWGEEVTGRKRE